MFRELETKRLRLKNIGFDDADFMYKQFSTHEVNEYLYDAEPLSSVAEANKLIEFYLADEPRDQHRWILIPKESGEKIGTCGFHCWNREDSSIEIGYDLQPAYWRQGYMSEAIDAILCFANNEMKLRKVCAHIYEHNIASQKTSEKLGFINTGRTYYEEFRGEKYLHYIYEKTL